MNIKKLSPIKVSSSSPSPRWISPAILSQKLSLVEALGVEVVLLDALGSALAGSWASPSLATALVPELSSTSSSRGNSTGGSSDTGRRLDKSSEGGRGLGGSAGDGSVHRGAGRSEGRESGGAGLGNNDR